MIKIKLHNTLIRKKQTFVPLDENNVRLYLCGPTVYDRAHLGNARNVIMFDVLYRLLIETYGIDSITYVRNFTDIDDKINNKSFNKYLCILFGYFFNSTFYWFVSSNKN